MKHLSSLRSTLLLLGLLAFLGAQGSYLRNVPQTLTQPNGAVVHCYASGDEYYHWLHDEQGFTIVRDRKTGYFCYATLTNGELQPTPFAVGTIDPASAGLKPGLNISPKRMLEKRQKFLNAARDYAMQKSAPAKAIPGVNTKGTINNIVIYIRFSGEDEFTENQSGYSEKFNSTTAGTLSLRNYYSEVSYGTLDVSTTFYPSNNGTNILSYQDTHTRNYFREYDATNNPTGYKNDTERTEREHTLLQAAVSYIAGNVSTSLNVDNDNDGYVDNVCFIVKGSPEGWNDLLWPHQWQLYPKTAYINSKRVGVYNLQLQTAVDVSVLCHEMFHSLGAPDLYHYDNEEAPAPVGVWDLMASDRGQHMTQYMKYRYGGWLNNIPEITTSGDYSLNPVFTKDNSCYKIRSPYSTTEYFVLEYRKKEKFDTVLPSEGLLVYRINTTLDDQGNASGPPDELYVYRPNGTSTVNGSLSAAPLSANAGRTSINDRTNPSSFLSNDGVGGLNISNVSAIGSTISFHVDIVTPATTDAAVTKLLTPVSGTSLTASEKVKVMISNMGTTSISSGLSVSFRLNGGNIVTESYTGIVPAGASIPFEFTTTADFSAPGFNYLEVFTGLAGDQNTANDSLRTYVNNPLSLEYLATLVTTYVGSYTELTGGTAIAVDQEKDGLSLPVTFPDGFTFNFNGNNFTQFVLSTNGFIKLGDQNPSSRALYFTTPQEANGGVFNSTSSADNMIIAPFNHDLVAGSGGADYRIDISGSAPDRVVTIQFKNVRDNDAQRPNQFNSMNFQVKLFETSNVIEFVYGAWTPSANPSEYKTSLCGLRGSGNSNGQLLAINKGSGMGWGDVTYSNSNYETTATLNFGNNVGGNRPLPEVGRTFRMIPRQENDLAVIGIRTLAELPLNYSQPHSIKAIVANYGTTQQTNVSVSLSVSGANSFAPANVTIPTINPNDTVTVTFAEFTPTALGVNTISVSLPADNNAANNTYQASQTVSEGRFSYATPGSFAYSGWTGSFIAACKYHVNGSAKVNSVNLAILNNNVMSGKSTTAYVINASGSIIGQSNTFTVASNHLGTWVSIPITTPPTVTNADFYVGISCANSYFASYQVEKPTRTGAFYQFGVSGGTPSEFGYNARLLIAANVTAATGIDTKPGTSPSIYSDTRQIFVDIPELRGIARVEVYNVLGALVYSSRELSQGLNTLNVALLPGAYIVKLSADGRTYTQKAVIGR
jgi:M6 family metalloprotease-like protein